MVADICGSRSPQGGMCRRVSSDSVQHASASQIVMQQVCRQRGWLRAKAHEQGSQLRQSRSPQDWGLLSELGASCRRAQVKAAQLHKHAGGMPILIPTDCSNLMQRRLLSTARQKSSLNKRGQAHLGGVTLCQLCADCSTPQHSDLSSCAALQAALPLTPYCQPHANCR